MEPTTGYAMLGDQRIAYQLLGDGSVDILIAPSWFSSFDVEWESPKIRYFLRRLASFARVIRLDRRGSGASDPLFPDALPPWESFAEDIGCVMDAVGSRTAVVFADGDAGPLALLFAASHPDRVRALVLFHTSARFMADEDYPLGIPWESFEEMTDQFTRDWGSGAGLSTVFPSLAGDDDFRRMFAKAQRAVTTPRAAGQYMQMMLAADVRRFLDAIEVPTLVLHPVNSRVLPVEHGRYLADHIASSRFIELPGGDVQPYFENTERVLEAIEEIVTGAPLISGAHRVLATVVFTDIVQSTSLAERFGDHRWRALLDSHDETVRRAIDEHSGRLIKTTGDGALATFDGPGRAVAFAGRVRREVAGLGLQIRTGIHTGEVELRDDDIGGVAVHLGARIMSAAEPGEILVSRTVKELVIGAQIDFEDRGLHRLKGVEGEWHLYSVADEHESIQTADRPAGS